MLSPSILLVRLGGNKFGGSASSLRTSRSNSQSNTLQHLRMKCAHSLNGSYLYPRGKTSQDHSLSHLFTRTLRREPVNGCSTRCWEARSLNPSNLFMILLPRKLVVSQYKDDRMAGRTKGVRHTSPGLSKGRGKARYFTPKGTQDKGGVGRKSKAEG